MSLSPITSAISENRFFSGFPVNREPDPDFFSLNPSPNQEKDYDISYSPIASAVFDIWFMLLLNISLIY